MTINSRNRRVFQMCLFVIIAIVTLGIGYASITAIKLLANGNATASVNQNNFIVHFVSAENITGTTGVSGTATYEGVNAEFDVTGLTKVGDYAIAKYTVRNDSASIGTEITLELANSNPEYFKVTETIDDNKLQAGEETYATVRVEMIKTPIQDEVSTIVTATLKASPIENENIIDSESNSISVPKDYIYTVTNTEFNIGRSIPIGAEVYNKFSDAKSESGYSFANAHILKDNIIVESYTVFELGGKLYYLRGGINENTKDEKPIYNMNVKTLKDAFGEENCTIHNYEFEEYFCRNGTLISYVRTIGGVVARPSNDSWMCHVNLYGSSLCYR